MADNVSRLHGLRFVPSNFIAGRYKMSLLLWFFLVVLFLVCWVVDLLLVVLMLALK